MIGTPITFYVNKFGFGVWDSHEDWARMGSFFGGIIGPIITSISLLFLAWQIGLQTKQRKDESTLHVCAECEADINTYLPKIIIFVNNIEKLEAMKVALAKNKVLIEQNKKEEALETIKGYISTELAVFSMWFHIDSCLRTLQKRKAYKFRRMRTLIFSQVEIEFLTYLDGVRMFSTKNQSDNCFFPD
jgi:hypothetical protein